MEDLIERGARSDVTGIYQTTRRCCELIVRKAEFLPVCEHGDSGWVLILVTES